MFPSKTNVFLICLFPDKQNFDRFTEIYDRFHIIEPFDTYMLFVNHAVDCRIKINFVTIIEGIYESRENYNGSRSSSLMRRRENMEYYHGIGQSI